jgi:RAB6A-GEF complex partner protein 1
MNWPIKYASVSIDGRLLAVAGHRGLLHYSSVTGRWKSFEDKTQEQAFCTKGGLVWFNHILIAAIEVPGSYQAWVNHGFFSTTYS